LVINELVTNAMKYAFPHGRSGHLLVALGDDGDGWFGLRFQDDGIGFEPDFRLDEADSLGLRLVRMFAKQLRAEVIFESAPGHTTFDLRFQDRARIAP
jgi:two-component sensor histidine kinase